MIKICGTQISVLANQFGEILKGTRLSNMKDFKVICFDRLSIMLAVGNVIANYLNNVSTKFTFSPSCSEQSG